MQEKQTRQNLRAAELITKYLQGNITDAEQAELEKWVTATEGSSRLMQEVTNTQMLQEGVEAFGHVDTDEKWERLLDRIITREKTTASRLRRITWRYAAAVLVLAVASWALITNLTRNTNSAGIASDKYATDLPPGSKKAELVLDNGRTVSLQANNDSSFMEAGVDVERTKTGLTYSGGANGITAWNTLKVPRGGEYMVILADGTKVWLNAASTLRYPVQFTGSERRIELTGEGYFEVAKNKDKPFIVATDRMDVQAVGTAFNVNSYATSPDSTASATLAEGKIKVTTKQKTVFIDPGQEVRTSPGATYVGKGNVEMALAWKNGFFVFNNTSLQEVTMQLSRWYDVSIVYDKNVEPGKLFTGEVNRNLPVSKLLERIEMTGIAKFRVDKSTVTVLPYTQ